MSETQYDTKTLSRRRAALHLNGHALITKWARGEEIPGSETNRQRLQQFPSYMGASGRQNTSPLGSSQGSRKL